MTLVFGFDPGALRSGEGRVLMGSWSRNAPVRRGPGVELAGPVPLSVDEERALFAMLDAAVYTAGRTSVMMALRGSRAAKVQRLGVVDQPGHGFYAGRSEEDVMARIDTCFHRGWLRFERTWDGLRVRAEHAQLGRIADGGENPALTRLGTCQEEVENAFRFQFSEGPIFLRGNLTLRLPVLPDSLSEDIEFRAIDTRGPDADRFGAFLDDVEHRVQPPQDFVVVPCFICWASRERAGDHGRDWKGGAEQ